MGDSLSGTIPNFELSPLGDIIQKASEIKVPTIDPVIEEASTFTENSDFTAAKTAAINAVYTTSETLPTVDSGAFKISEKFKKITQSFGGVSITKEGTTPNLAFENDVRKTISNKGFTNRVFTITEKFTVSDIKDLEGDKVVTLKHEPSKIIKVKGRTVATESERYIFEVSLSIATKAILDESTHVGYLARLDDVIHLSSFFCLSYIFISYTRD